MIESITTNPYQWSVTRVTTIAFPKNSTRVYEFTKTTTLYDFFGTTIVAQIQQMIKSMMTTYDTAASEPIKVVTNANVVACIYCGEALLFEECSTNPFSINYVGKNKYKNS